MRLSGDPGGLAAFAVLGPGLGQVELAVDQGVPLVGGVGGEDADLAVLGPSRGAGVLALDAGGDGALLDEAGVVDDQDTVGGAEALGDVGLEVVADLVCVPAGSCEQVLQPVRGRMACVLGQLPAVLAACRAKESLHVVPHPPPGFNPAEAGPDS